MAATRRQSPLEIFQDPSPSPDHHEAGEFEAQLLSAFASVTDVSTDQHTLLHPPSSQAGLPSPRKTSRVSSSPPPSALVEKGLNTISIPPPPLPEFITDSLMKRSQRPIAKPARRMSKAQNTVFPPFPTAQFDKENVHADLLLILDEENTPLFSNALHEQKAPLKRTLMDAAPIAPLRDRTNKKQKSQEVKVQDEDPTPLPEPDEMPAVEDDGKKPQYSYANLIGMAILRAPNRRLTLAQIYKWISDTFIYYRSSETGWQNSIRHNLSLSKAFSKQERPKDDPGKGHYWRINPGFEKQFHKAKSSRRTTNPDGFVQALPSDLLHPSTASFGGSFPLPSSVVKNIDSSKFPEENEPSSDATIPCSDPAAHDGQEPEHHMPPPSRAIPSSPPPVDIRSSPPPPISRPLRDGTPPRFPRVPSNSRSGGRKRKFAALGDSGYYSSIESSAIKGNPLGPLLTSEADMDRPVIKRGRAEEEIARIRGSSYDSPSKTRSFMKPPNSSHPPSSSPFRPFDSHPDGPLTPAVIFKRPAMPPASVSPNTNLRAHRNRIRELIGGSPDKSMGVMIDNHIMYQPWSPAVQIPDESTFNLHESGFHDSFDVFTDIANVESPSKPSAKRPRLERAATTTGILADITGLKANARSSTPTSSWKSPFLNIPSLDSPARFVSPMKGPTSNPDFNFSKSMPDPDPLPRLSPSHNFDLPNDDLFGVDLPSDESEETGFDILQGFQKIGAPTVAPNGSPSKPPPPRPSFTRSSTTRF
ncbi:hypothetical protein K432DRAFT_289836 [Lepidopterella palustris CBS 459.81]|uniref:Fork-head domain-containing protein n=1 Tax=Lepidopterella palustris CBS 459.81 TaxID=1314670 RepID=A0A8E2EHF0_9PEZI|nr:hypothetical protein K432DRAFT_289836 [Lepidopterella palustris CBS 459.81]